MGACDGYSNTKKEQKNILWDPATKGYSTVELTRLKGYLTESINWITTTGFDPYDLLILRIGIPNMLSDEDSESTEVYKAEFGAETSLLKTSMLSVDYIKLSRRIINTAMRDIPTEQVYNDTYYFASRFAHSRFSNYFKQGIYNASKKIRDAISDPKDTTFDFVNVLNTKGLKSPLSPVKTKYNLGVDDSRATGIFYDIPACLYKTITMTINNIDLLKTFSSEDLEVADKTRVVIGDTLVIGTSDLLTRFNSLSTSIDAKIAKISKDLVTDVYYRDLKFIFEEIGYESSFKSIDYGGEIDDARILLRIPLSWENEKILRGLLEIEEARKHYNYSIDTIITDEIMANYFTYVFPIIVFYEEMHKDKNIKELKNIPSAKVFFETDNIADILAKRPFSITNPISSSDLWDLNQWYDLNMQLQDYDIINLLNANELYTDRGCKIIITEATQDADGAATTLTTTNYRYVLVNQEWLFGPNAASFEKVLLVASMGMDLKIDMNKPCGFDTIIIVIIIIIVTCLATDCTTTAPTIEVVLAWLSAAISIGLTLGIWEGKTAKKMAILAALLSLGSAYMSSGNIATMGTRELAALAIQMLSPVISIANTMEAIKHQEFIDDYDKTMEEFSAEMFEGDLRFYYGKGPYVAQNDIFSYDYYGYVKDEYDKFTTYKTSGFKSSTMTETARDADFKWG